MSRTRAKKTTPATTTATRFWQWAVALCCIAGIVAVSAYAVIRHGSAPLAGRAGSRGAGATPVQPVAQVLIGRERYLLDETGLRLRSAPAGGAVLKGLIEIQGVEAPPHGKVGERWGTPVVEAAARLAALLDGERESLGIVAIEVDESAVQAELRLRTAGGSRVLWECWPEDARERTLSTEAKLQRLRGYVETEGSLDAPVDTGPYLHDVRFASKHTRKGLPKN